MTTSIVDTVDVNSLTEHIDAVEGAIRWCIDHRARVKFGSHEVLIVTETHIGCNAPTFLEAVYMGREIEARVP